MRQKNKTTKRHSSSCMSTSHENFHLLSTNSKKLMCLATSMKGSHQRQVFRQRKGNIFRQEAHFHYYQSCFLHGIKLSPSLCAVSGALKSLASCRFFSWCLCRFLLPDIRVHPCVASWRRMIRHQRLIIPYMKLRHLKEL